MVSPRHLMAVVTFLIGGVVLLGVGCAGTSSETSKKEQGHAEATEGQARSSEATASEEDRCEGTQAIDLPPGPYQSIIDLPQGPYITNDIPGCPNKGDVLSGNDLPGTNGRDKLYGGEGEDFKIRGLGGSDELWGGFDKDYMDGGRGDDFLVGGTKPEEGQDKSMDFLDGGPGNDEVIGGRGNDVVRGGSGGDVIDGGSGADQLYGEGLMETDPPGQHEDVFRGGDGNDQIDALDGQRDELYCGGGWDRYMADESGDRYFANDKDDYVDSSCEKEGLSSVA